MKGALLPQMLELWNISKTQFGILMSIYGIVHNILYVALAWVQDRFSARVLIPVNMVMGGLTTFFLGQTTDFVTLCFLFVMLSLWCEGAFWPAVLSAVRKTTDDTNQGKIFGLLEGGRGAVELLQNWCHGGALRVHGLQHSGLAVGFHDEHSGYDPSWLGGLVFVASRYPAQNRQRLEIGESGSAGGHEADVALARGMACRGSGFLCLFCLYRDAVLCYLPW